MIICYNSVIPSLYIFMVISDYRSQPEIMTIISFPFRWYGKLMKIEDRYYSGSLMVSLLGGFAVGASYLKKLKERKYPAETLNVLSISMINNSFAFCVFAIGQSYLGSIWPGLLIFISLIISSLITSFLFSFFYQYNIVSVTQNTKEKQSSFINSVKKSVENILAICGFVILFNFICEAISLYTKHKIVLMSILVAFTEVTCSIVNLINIYGKNLYLICFLLSIYPICTLCQVYYFTDSVSVLKTLMLSRLIHTPVSLLILSILIHVFPQAAIVNSAILPVYSLISDSMELSSVIFIITLLFLVIFDKNKMFTKTK